MAVNPLDPTQPTLLSSSIDLTAELRAIKQRLVTDKDNIDQLQQTLVDISGITPYSATLLAAADSDAWLGLLNFSAIGIDLSQLSNYDDLADALGVQDPVPAITIGANKWTIALPGTLKLNIVKLTVPSSGTTVTWQTPFTTAVYGVWATLNSNGDFPIFVTSVDTVGCYADHNNASAKDGFILSVGQ